MPYQTEFDTNLQRVAGLTWLPWIGEKYALGKVLVLGGGYKLDGRTLGVSLNLCSTGFMALFWENINNRHDVQSVGDVLSSHPELQNVFSGRRDGDNAWCSPELIPFDSVVDWLKNLQGLLKRLQLSNQ